MARVRPFRAWRYARHDHDLTSLAAPPYDVVSDGQRAALLERDPHNIVALELPAGPLDPTLPNNRYVTGKCLWDEWRESGILAQDADPQVYVLEQRFTQGDRSVRRRAFIVEVALEPLDAGIVIPHERTLPKALGDRFELTKATGANLSQVFGLFEDARCGTDRLFEAVQASEPLATAVDADGVQSTLWGTSDPSLHEDLSRFMAERQLFIADGHHRYTTALAYRAERRAQAEGPSADAPYDSIMMALANMDDPDLVVLPYHRIADSSEAFDQETFDQGLSRHFDVSDLPAGHAADVMLGHDRPAFMIKTRHDQRPRLAVLKADVDVDTLIPLDHSHAWKCLDVAVLQELILWPLLGVHPDRPETLERLRFTKDAHAAFAATAEHDVALVLRPTPLEQLRSVSLGGEIMPQKSTYFYPKLPSGLVMRSAE